MHPPSALQVVGRPEGAGTGGDDLFTFPGLALTLAGVGFSLIGDGLADALRPRS